MESYERAPSEEGRRMIFDPDTWQDKRALSLRVKEIQPKPAGMWLALEK